MEIYTCAKCKKLYSKPNPHITCTGLHAPGNCCHYGEVEITTEMMNDAKDAAFAEISKEAEND